MFDVNEPKRISAKLLFTICALIGAIVFIGIYSVRVLDFSNVGWLFDNDSDLRQHYVAWCRFRTDPWRFPFGLIDSLSYPNSMSVIYTDSIPIFAVAFKILGPVLPQTFQYFGLFGILSFMLMGGFASILLRRFIESDIQCIIGSVFYVASSTVIHRMYYHTALAAQWIVVAALVLWVYNELIPSNDRRIIYWALMGFVCVGIHSYFLPMVGMILAVTIITQIARKKVSFFASVPVFLSFCASGLVNLYILGAFYGGTSPSGPGLGTFNSNLNTFINPWEIGQFIPRLNLFYDFQYEGMAYLGAGILLLFFIVAGGMVFRTVRKIPEKAFHTDPIYGRMTLLLVAVSFLAAVFPNFSFNSIKLFWAPVPGILEKILGIFRSNGRLVWPAMYILMTAAISFTAYTFRRYRQIGTIVLACALILQIADMTNALAARHAIYSVDHPSDTMWDDPAASAFVEGKSEFIFLYDENDISMPTAYYGYFHNMRQNNYYFARDIGDKVRAEIDTYRAELAAGNIRDDAVYVIRQKDFDEDPAFYEGLGADMLFAFDHVIFKAGTQ